jgi:GT2 family glycosyltransferase
LVKEKIDPKVYIVIPHKGGKDILIDCLQSIAESSYKNLTVVVIDNGSNDDSIQFVQNRYPDIEILSNKENVGFSKAVNQGVLYALSKGCDYIFLLNNDTVLHPECIKNLINSVNYNGCPETIGAVGPKILNFGSDREVWFMGAKIDLYRGIWQKAHERANQITEVESVSGCAVLFSIDIFSKIGMFDENFYTYVEDFDFFIRLNRSNFKIIINPDAKVWHKGGATGGSGDTPFKIYYITRNRLLVMKKHARLEHWCYYIPFSIYHILRNVYILYKSGEVQKTRFILKAILDFFLGRFGKQLTDENQKII